MVITPYHAVSRRVLIFTSKVERTKGVCSPVEKARCQSVMLRQCQPLPLILRWRWGERSCTFLKFFQ